MFPNMIIWFLLLAASASAYIPSLSLLPGDSLSPNPDPTANRLASPDWVAVICHGAWHPPIFYQPLGDALEAQGVESYCPLLPTCNITDVNVEDQSNPVLSEGPPPWGWPTAQGDADVIVDLLNTLIERQGKKVLLIGHSYGGWVASQSALPRLQLQHRQSQGKSGGIFGILGFSAYLIPIGMSMGDFIQEPVPPWSRLYVSFSHIRVPVGILIRGTLNRRVGKTGFLRRRGSMNTSSGTSASSSDASTLLSFEPCPFPIPSSPTKHSENCLGPTL